MMCQLEKRNVVVHCNAGASRSPSFVMAYLMVRGLSFDQAYRFLKSKRLIVDVQLFESALRELDIEALRKELV